MESKFNFLLLVFHIYLTVSDFLRAKERSHKENQQRVRWFKSTSAWEIKVLAVVSTARREKYSMSKSTFWIKVSGQKVLWFICSCYEQANKKTIISHSHFLISDQRREFLIRKLQEIKVSIKKPVRVSHSDQLRWGQRLWRELQTAHISARWNQATTSSSMTSSHRNIVMYALHDALQLLSI